MSEADLIASPLAAVQRVLQRWDGATAISSKAGGALGPSHVALVTARRLLAYRTRGSLVGSFALQEAWSSCMAQPQTRAGPELPKC